MGKQSNSKKPVEKGEFRSGPIAGTALISGVNFENKRVKYANVDGLAIFEGDIILGTVEEIKANENSDNPVLHSIGITGQQFRWPNGVIPYEIESSIPNQSRITDAIDHWENNTRISFVLRNSSNASVYPNYIRFRSGSGCSSHVGMQGGRQNITLSSRCSTGNAIHEIGHAIGLWHEHSREDRDSHVRIQWVNIDPGRAHNFDQHITDGDDLGPYDFGSIMHYPGTAFSINGDPTIVPLSPLPPGIVMGQRNGLSQGDIDGVHAMYPLIIGPPTTTIKEVPKDPISDPVHTIKEVGKDPVFDPTPTFKEVGKDPIFDPAPTYKEVRKDPIFDPGPTIKEVGKDPTMDPGKPGTSDPTWVEHTNFPGGHFNPHFAGTPFVMATPHHYNAQNKTHGQPSANSKYDEIIILMQSLENNIAQSMMLQQEVKKKFESFQSNS
ncbi:Dot/Icm T4SS effector Zinc-dependent metalloprotease LegP [uncultured Psychroserpens sp.]|uniref:Dot/Icm T4SS effector Zinc-dependent metalloprotease LegP n=1 Tax=uncultured Psychroserpens sp. TaxID=255436 RepID=UPI0026153947|nr:Dot/Icm T4SS effector Zinc-dependent metalloprotease LegP [uncultured Psychroserpens sp.]